MSTSQPSVWIFLFARSLSFFLPTSSLGGGNKRFFSVEVAPSPCLLIIPSYSWRLRTAWGIWRARPWELHCTAATGSPRLSSLLCWVAGAGWGLRWACWPSLESHVCLQLSNWTATRKGKCRSNSPFVHIQREIVPARPGTIVSASPPISNTLSIPGCLFCRLLVYGPEFFTSFLWSSSASSNDLNPLWLVGYIGGTTARSCSKWLLC